MRLLYKIVVQLNYLKIKLLKLYRSYKPIISLLYLFLNTSSTWKKKGGPVRKGNASLNTNFRCQNVTVVLRAYSFKPPAQLRYSFKASFGHPPNPCSNNFCSLHKARVISNPLNLNLNQRKVELGGCFLETLKGCIVRCSVGRCYLFVCFKDFKTKHVFFFFCNIIFGSQNHTTLILSFPSKFWQINISSVLFFSQYCFEFWWSQLSILLRLLLYKTIKNKNSNQPFMKL